MTFRIVGIKPLGLLALLATPIQALPDVVNDPDTGAQIRSSCDSYDLRVADDKDYADRFAIAEQAQEPPEFASAEPIWGPDRNSYIKLLAADQTVPPGDAGWRSSMLVASADGKFYMATVTGHGNGGVRPYWRERTLIEVEVWWGRIVKTVFAIEASTGDIWSAQRYNYFEMILPCKEE